jgi:hypothetical protein
MSISAVLKMFQPKDRIFYNLFEKVGGQLVQMSNQFVVAINEQDLTKRDQLLRNLSDMEHKNDEVTHEIFLQLGQNFITPMDREDIHYLATSLDDIADYIWGSAKLIVNYQIEDEHNILPSFAQIIVNAVAAVNKAIDALRDMKDLKTITDSCISINSYANEADKLLDEAMMTLFKNCTNAVELIKRKDIYEMLEMVTSKCEDVANVIESIIIKYS